MGQGRRIIYHDIEHIKKREEMRERRTGQLSEKRMNQPRRRMVMDGLKEIPKKELHSFIGTAFWGSSWLVVIPIQIARELSITKGAKLLIAVKKATEREIKEYTAKT